VSGEPEYLENMQLLYGKKAAEKDVCIIGSCGFDSVPADLGFLFTKNSFKSKTIQSSSNFQLYLIKTKMIIKK
jgi:short subunit dehydrogenase-like uncharacterized protein